MLSLVDFSAWSFYQFLSYFSKMTIMNGNHDKKLELSILKINICFCLLPLETHIEHNIIIIIIRGEETCAACVQFAGKQSNHCKNHPLRPDNDIKVG